MNKSAEVTNKIVEQLYSNESEIFKNETKQCLDENVRNIEMHFNDDPERMIKFAESIAVYFQLKFQGNSGQTLASLVETREQVICFPKGERAVNGFNAFNRVMKYEPKKAGAEWKALSPEAQEKFKDPVNQPIRESKNLLEFGPFMKWNKETFNLLTNHNIHVLSIVAHEHEKGRIIDPVIITNSTAAHKLNVEIATKYSDTLPARLERLATEHRLSEEEHERSIVAHTVKRMATAIMEGEKKKNKKPQEKKYPSEILREENLKVIKEKLTAMIWSRIPREGIESDKLFLTHFNEEGIYQKGQKKLKFNNWPLKSVHGLRGYKSHELRTLRNALEKNPDDEDAVTLTELE